MKIVLVVLAASVAVWGQSVYSGSVANRGTATLGPSTIGDVFVALSGNDGNPCTLLLPCLTLQHASAVVRGLPGGNHIVSLRAGSYFLNATWILDSGDSGNAARAIVYQSYPGETAVISGGRKVTGSWTADSYFDCGAGCTAFYMDLDGDPADSGSYVNFESLFYNGARRPRPQGRSGSGGYLTNACPGTNSAPMCVGGANQAAADVACGCPAGAGACSFPSTPCAGSTPWMCFNKFMYSNSDVSGTWRNIGLGDIEFLGFERWSMGRGRLASAAGGVASLTGPMNLSDGQSGCLPGYSYVTENVKEEARKGEWYLDRGVHVSLTWNASTSSGVTGYKIYRGASSGGPYTNVGLVSGTTLSFQDYGVMLGTTYYYVVTTLTGTAESGYSSEVQAVVPSSFNAPSNQWRLYVFADTAAGEDPNAAEVLVPGLSVGSPQLLTGSGLQYVTFRNLTFQHDNWMAGAYGLGDTSGMPLVPGAIGFANSSNITFDGVTVSQVQGWGIDFQGGSKNNQIVNSALYDLGAGGIRFGGRAAQSDTANNVPSGELVQNTVVAYYGRIQPTGEGPGISLGDVHDSTITHNDIFGGYTGCFNLGYGLNRGANDGSSTTQFFTYNNTVSWNHCYGQIANGLVNGILSDFGGIHVASSLSANCPTSGQPTLIPNTYCNHIVFNRFHDLVHNYDDPVNQGAQGIYLDQGSSAVEVRFNLVYRIGHTCVFNSVPQALGPNQYLAQWNLFENNIFADCGIEQTNHTRVVNRGGSNGNSFTWRKNIGYFNGAIGNMNPQSGPGHWGCFADDLTTAVPCTDRFLMQSNLWWNVASGHGMSFNTCKSGDCSGAFPGNFNLYTTLPWAGEDVGSVQVDPLFVNPVYGVDDWHPQADLSGIGMQLWDYTQAGRTNPVIAVPGNVPDLFPLRPVNPLTDF